MTIEYISVTLYNYAILYDTEAVIIMSNILFEQFSLKHWPAIVTEQYDGWLLRYSNGYTKRANSISTMHAPALNIQDKISYAEQYYHAKNIPTVFKITPTELDQQLDQYLQTIGYGKQAPTLVMATTLDTLPLPKPIEVNISEHISVKWIEQFCQLSGKSEEIIGTMIDILTRINARTLLISIIEDKKVVSCGLGVIEEGYIGLYCIVTHHQYRNKGYGEQLILHLLQYAKQKGAHTSYLAVEEGNIAARKLYDKLNFQKQYRYWYRSNSVC